MYDIYYNQLALINRRLKLENIYYLADKISKKYKPIKKIKQ